MEKKIIACVYLIDVLNINVLATCDHLVIMFIKT